jgi:hypothetical protein
MTFKKILLAIILALPLATLAQDSLNITPKLSPQAEIAIIEIDRANDELFQAFGHIAVHITDPSSYFDRVYSYGAFDFSTQSFYWKFITGQLPYQMSLSNLQYTLMEYGPNYENRTVKKYTINLTHAQKQRVYDLLEENYLPQNRTYQYKFFQDNCSSRIRDIFAKALGNNLVWGQISPQNTTYRDWMNSRLEDLTLAGFFMNIAIGNPSDRPNTNAEAMYLPANLAQAFARGRNQNQPLVSKTETLYKSTRKPYTASNISFAFLFLIPLLLSMALGKLPVLQKTLLKAYLFAIGIAGLLIVFLWFFTKHGVTEQNLSILWAWPTHIWAAWKLQHVKLQKYFSVWLITSLLYAAYLLFTRLSGANSYNNLDVFILISSVCYGLYFWYFSKKNLPARN